MNPFKNMNKTLVVDADSIIFISCYNATKDLLPEEFYITLDDYEDAIIHLAHTYAKNQVKNMLDATGCESAELYFTAGRNNFRYKIDPTYKQNRKGQIPPFGVSQVKELMKGVIFTDIEADEYVVWRGKQKDTIIAAIDKDVLGQVAGTHYNYRKNEYVTTTRKDAKRFVYEQLLIGDTADGIYGVDGIGKVKAKKALQDSTNYMATVWELYKEVGKSKTELLNNWNLLDMHILDKKGEVKLHTMEELKKEIEDE